MPKNTACACKIKKSRHINCRLKRLCAGGGLRSLHVHVLRLSNLNASFKDVRCLCYALKCAEDVDNDN